MFIAKNNGGRKRMQREQATPDVILYTGGSTSPVLRVTISLLTLANKKVSLAQNYSRASFEGARIVLSLF